MPLQHQADIVVLDNSPPPRNASLTMPPSEEVIELDNSPPRSLRINPHLPRTVARQASSQPQRITQDSILVDEAPRKRRRIDNPSSIASLVPSNNHQSIAPTSSAPSAEQTAIIIVDDDEPMHHTTAPVHPQSIPSGSLPAFEPIVIPDDADDIQTNPSVYAPSSSHQRATNTLNVPPGSSNQSNPHTSRHRASMPSLLQFVTTDVDSNPLPSVHPGGVHVSHPRTSLHRHGTRSRRTPFPLPTMLGPSNQYPPIMTEQSLPATRRAAINPNSRSLSFTRSFTNEPLSPQARASLQMLTELEEHGSISAAMANAPTNIIHVESHPTSTRAPRHSSSRHGPLRNAQLRQPQGPAPSWDADLVPDALSGPQVETGNTRRSRGTTTVPRNASIAERQAHLRRILQEGDMQESSAPHHVWNHPHSASNILTHPHARRLLETHVEQMGHALRRADPNRPGSSSRHQSRNAVRASASSTRNAHGIHVRIPSMASRPSTRVTRGVTRTASTTATLLGGRPVAGFRGAGFLRHRGSYLFLDGAPRVEISYFHSFPTDRSLDYEHLIRLDEELIREKNRADKEQIEAIPTEKATSNDKDIRCCICMCDVEEGQELRVLPCSHKYHKGCIDGKLSFSFSYSSTSSYLFISNFCYFIFFRRMADLQWMLPG